MVGIFFTTFLSTGNVPLADQTGWVHGVARINPFTNILELARQGMISGVTWGQSWPGTPRDRRIDGGAVGVRADRAPALRPVREDERACLS